jgi:hypothetical protein
LVGSIHQHGRCDFAEQLRQGHHSPAFLLPFFSYSAVKECCINPLYCHPFR